MSDRYSTLDLDYLRSILKYCPATGLFSYLRPVTRSKVGDIAGCPTGKGYIRITIDGVHYHAHRLAMLYIYGRAPAIVDHKDGVITHNWIENLREASRNENSQNRKGPNRNNKSTGLMGVYPARGTDRFTSKIYADGKTVCLGTYDTPEEAHAVYIEAKKRLHPGFIPR